MSDLEILNALAEIERQRHHLRRLLLEIKHAQCFLIVLGIWLIAGAIMYSIWV